MFIKHILLPALVLLGGLTGATGQHAHQPLRTVDKILTVSEISDALRRHNPSLAAARYTLAEAEAQRKSAGRLANPEFFTGIIHDPRYREIGGTVGFRQSFPFTSRLKIEKDLSVALLLQAEQEIEVMTEKLIGEAHMIAVRLLTLQAHEVLHKQHLKLADELANYAEEVAKKGEGSPLDASQTRLEANQQMIELRELDTRAEKLRAELATIIGFSHNTRITLEGSLDAPTLPDFHTATLQNRAVYRATRLGIAAADESTQLERSKRWQDITASLFTGVSREEDNPIGLEREHRIGFQVSIPLPLWDKNEGQIEKAQSRKERMEHTLKAVAHKIQSDASQSYQSMKSEARLVQEITSLLIPAAEQQQTKSINAYQAGQISLEPVLRSREQLIELRAARLHALRDFHLARVSHAIAHGTLQFQKP